MSAYVHPETCCWCVDSLRAGRDALKAENAELKRVMQLETLADVQLLLLREALVKIKRHNHNAVPEGRMGASEILGLLVPYGEWGLGVTGGEPE